MARELNGNKLFISGLFVLLMVFDPNGYFNHITIIFDLRAILITIYVRKKQNFPLNYYFAKQHLTKPQFP